MTRRLVVYSAIFGDRDVPQELPNEDFDYFLFTDQILKLSKGYVIYLERPLADPKRSAGMYKTIIPNFLFNYEMSLWLDSSIKLLTADGLEKFVSEKDLAVFTHSERDCIYNEAGACIGMQKDKPETITAQMDRYRNEKYPERNGLVATGGLLRKHTDNTRFFGQCWWEEIEKGSRRDQLSFNYVLWKLGMTYQPLSPGTIWCNPWWRYKGHASAESQPV